MALGGKPDRRSILIFSPPAHLYRHIYYWNIVACDVKQPISQSGHHRKWKFISILGQFVEDVFLNNKSSFVKKNPYVMRVIY